MPLLMCSTKYIFLLAVVFISACSSGVKQPLMTETEPPSTGKVIVSDAEKHLYRQAITVLNADQLETAENKLKEFSLLKPEFAGPYANLGLVYYKQGKTELARQTLNKALEKNHQQAHALNLLGQIAYDQGNAKNAEQYYQQAITINPDYANAHYNLALLYDIYYQDIARAVNHYRRYMELTGNTDNDTANWLEQLENSLKGS